MFQGLALNRCDLSDALIEQHRLMSRVTLRSASGNGEIHFLHRARPRLIPAWYQGELCVLPWGCSVSGFPRDGMIERDSIAEGKWQSIPFEHVVIPATLGLDRGVWYQIREGIQGVIHRRGREAYVFMLLEDASHYYQVMTRSDKMPVLIGERI